MDNKPPPTGAHHLVITSNLLLLVVQHVGWLLPQLLLRWPRLLLMQRLEVLQTHIVRLQLWAFMMAPFAGGGKKEGN